jgi:hypothetical protein
MNHADKSMTGALSPLGQYPILLEHVFGGGPCCFSPSPAREDSDWPWYPLELPDPPEHYQVRALGLHALAHADMSNRSSKRPEAIPDAVCRCKSCAGVKKNR